MAEHIGSERQDAGPFDPIVRSGVRLCATLERIGDALVALDVDTLLETEETLRQLLAAIEREHRTEDPAAIETLVHRGRAALLQCRRLGGAFTHVARARLPLHTGVEIYSRDAEYLEPAVLTTSVKVTV